MDSVQTFHRYRLIRRIARGGMAEVFLAAHRGAAGFERRVALKKILPVYSGMEEFASLFRDESRVAAALDHSGIVQVYDFGEHTGEYYIAMEYVDGPDLEEVLDRCRRRGILPPVEVVLHIGHRLAGCLEYAHSRFDSDGRALEIIHRDVSPPNLLIGVQGEIKLTDFGVAKSALREGMTRPGVLRGKYAYMSPEQVSQKPMDQRSDLFSLGTVLYEALTGVNPFEGSTDYQTMESVEAADVEPAGFLRPDTPAELDRILVTCLEPDPADRYQDAGALRRDLAGLMLTYPRSDDPQCLVDFLQDVFPERSAADNRAALLDGSVPAWEMLAHRLSPMLVTVPPPPPPVDGAPIRLVSRPGEERPDGERDSARGKARAIFREVGPRARRKRRNTDRSAPVPEDSYVTDPGLQAPNPERERPRVSFLPAFDESLDRIPATSLPVLGEPDPEPERIEQASVRTPFVSLAEEGDPLLSDLSVAPPLTDGGVPIVNEWDLDDADWSPPPRHPSSDEMPAVLAADLTPSLRAFGAVVDAPTHSPMAADLFTEFEDEAPLDPPDAWGVAAPPMSAAAPGPLPDPWDATTSDPPSPPSEESAAPGPRPVPRDATTSDPPDHPSEDAAATFDSWEDPSDDAALPDPPEDPSDGASLDEDDSGSDSYVPTHPSLSPASSLAGFAASASSPPEPESLEPEDLPTELGLPDLPERAAWEQLLSDAGEPVPDSPPFDDAGAGSDPAGDTMEPIPTLGDVDGPDVSLDDVAGALHTGTVPGQPLPASPSPPREIVVPIAPPRARSGPPIMALGIGLPTPRLMPARRRRPARPSTPDGELIEGWDVAGPGGARAMAELLAEATAGGTEPSSPAWPITPEGLEAWKEGEEQRRSEERSVGPSPRSVPDEPPPDDQDEPWSNEPSPDEPSPWSSPGQPPSPSVPHQPPPPSVPHQPSPPSVPEDPSPQSASAEPPPPLRTDESPRPRTPSVRPSLRRRSASGAQAPADAPPLRIGRAPRMAAPSRPGSFLPRSEPATSLPLAQRSAPGASSPAARPTNPGRSQPGASVPGRRVTTPAGRATSPGGAPSPHAPPAVREGGLLDQLAEHRRTLLLAALAILVPLLLVFAAGQLDRDPARAVPQPTPDEAPSTPRYVEPLSPIGNG